METKKENRHLRPRVVISRCIEFEACRWNGAVISSDFVRKLKAHVEPLTPCPEKDIGLGVPRKPVRLVADGEKLLMKQSETGLDVTEKMNRFSDKFLSSLGEVDGFILKDRSPSCGIKDVKVYPDIGKVSPLPRKEAGLFAARVAARYPDLPVENEGRLTNLALREHFLSHLYARARFRSISREGKVKDLVEFHSDYKYLFMAYSQATLKKLGVITANRDKKNPQELFAEYGSLMGELFARPPRKGQVINVLMHCLGYFSKELTSEEKAHFLDMMEAYRSEKLPLSACQILLYSWARRFGEEYLLRQVFFHPYPEELIDLRDSAT